MGILDKIFNGRKKDTQNQQLNQEELSHEVDKSKREVEKSIQAAEDHITKIETIVSALDNNSTSQNIKNIASRQAQVSNLRLQEQEFRETHRTVQEFREKFLATQLLKTMGITRTEEKEPSPYVERFEILRSSGLVDNRYLNKIFLPYLVEKKTMGIITQKEQQELDAMMGRTGKLSDIENATTQDSYTSDFDHALIILGAIGVIEFPDFLPCKEFPNGREMRDVYKLLNGFDLKMKAYDLAQKISMQQNKATDNKVQLTPTVVAKNALRQTSRTKTEEATYIEQSELNAENTKEGETRDD